MDVDGPAVTVGGPLVAESLEDTFPAPPSPVPPPAPPAPAWSTTTLPPHAARRAKPIDSAAAARKFTRRLFQAPSSGSSGAGEPEDERSEHDSVDAERDEPPSPQVSEKRGDHGQRDE